MRYRGEGAVKAALKRFYDLMPVSAQNLLLSMFSARLSKTRYGGRYREFRDLLEQSQYWDSSRIRAWQEERLRRVLEHAYEHVPYYRASFRAAGYDPAHFNGLGDLAHLPILDRDVVKHRVAELRSRASSSLTEGHTSGTTGSPISLFYDADMIAMNYAVMDRQYAWAGLRMGKDGDRAAVLRGNVIVPLEQKRPPYWRRNAAMNQMMFSTFHLSPQNLPAYLGALREFAPAVLDGYPSSLYVLAKLLLNQGERLPLRASITSSETLYDFQRQAIEAAFECRVFDYYAAAERVIFSVECDHHRGHHLCEEYGVTEVVDEHGRVVVDGQEGFIVGTTLHNLGMPLIRYRTTDRGARKIDACSCGRGLPLMEDITTKAEDVLRLRDGRLISPSVLTHPFKPLDSIEGSQLIQTDLDRLLVRIVPGGRFNEGDRSHLVRELKARLGEDMRIDIEVVDELPRTSRGKFKWVVNQVGTGL
jgi:phenylacetate-CoA ligase